MRKRRVVPIAANPTFAFVVDGECEVWYLQMLKRNERSITVNIVPRIPQKKSLLEQFEMIKALSVDYTKVFWLVDFDVVLEDTRKAKKGSKTALQTFCECKSTLGQKYPNVVIIVNVPCIEFWFLLHFELTTRYFEKCNSAERKLKRYLKDYEKTRNYYTKQDNDIYLR